MLIKRSATLTTNTAGDATGTINFRSDGQYARLERVRIDFDVNGEGKKPATTCELTITDGDAIKIYDVTDNTTVDGNLGQGKTDGLDSGKQPNLVRHPLSLVVATGGSTKMVTVSAFLQDN